MPRGSEEGRRAGLGKAGVEVAGALGKDFDGGVGLRILDWRPVDEVGGGGEANGDLAPVHPEFAVDPCGDEVRGLTGACNDGGYDSAGLVHAGGRSGQRLSRRGPDRVSASG